MHVYHHHFYHHATNTSRQCLLRLSTTSLRKEKADHTFPDIAFTLPNFPGHTQAWTTCIRDTRLMQECQHYRILTEQVIILPCTHPTLPWTWCLLTIFQIFLHPFLKMNIYLVPYFLPLLYSLTRLFGWMADMLKLREENVLHGWNQKQLWHTS